MTQLTGNSISFVYSSGTGPELPEIDARAVFGVFVANTETQDLNNGLIEPRWYLTAQRTTPEGNLYSFTLTDLSLDISWESTSDYEYDDLVLGTDITFESEDTTTFFNIDVRVFGEEGDLISDKQLAVAGESIGPPPLWPAIADGLYQSAVKTWPTWTFAKPTVNQKIINVDVGLWMVVTETDGNTWQSQRDGLGLISITAPAAPIPMSVIGMAQSADVLYELAPLRIVTTVSPQFKKSDAPRGQQELLTYAKSLVTQGVGITSEVTAFDAALAQSRNPGSRSPVTVQAAKDAETALRAAIASKVAPQQREAYQTQRNAAPVAGNPPQITRVTQRPGICTFSFKGAPKSRNERWFEFQVTESPDDEDSETEEFEATKSPFRWNIPAEWGGRAFFVRGRWVVKYGTQYFKGPYTEWKKYTALNIGE